MNSALCYTINMHYLFPSSWNPMGGEGGITIHIVQIRKLRQSCSVIFPSSQLAEPGFKHKLTDIKAISPYPTSYKSPTPQRIISKG